MAQMQLKNIHKIYDNGFHAVHDLNLSVEKGEFIVFVGPSGCGKSTSLRMIAGLEVITDGDLFIRDLRANEKSPRDRGIAMVFQSYALYPHMNVYENMAFGLTLKGLDEDIIEGRVMRTAKILGLTDYLHRFPRELSGGQRQRVAVGRAIIRRVEIFLMDEPLSNLDAKQRVSMRAEIIQIHRRIGATTIYVTHDQTEAMTMADRIVVMKDGFVQQIGTPHELYFNPANMFVAGFIGEPPMNFIPFERRESTLLGFRPEDAAIIPAGESAPSGSFTFEGDIELTEMLGDNANVYVKFGSNNVIAKVSPHEIPEMDTKRLFAIPSDKLFFFDETTGTSVCDAIG
ncbi:MAG: ATP-binding cassette domain-containing protein [Oscillospiraceae bacterium]|jgi:multiple sugar transport system ATP-binding protein|nr:ATP-binding cassette domain-containing protein [Oscillospiraceae bacterium]